MTEKQKLQAQLIKAQIDADYQTDIAEIVAGIDGMSASIATRIFTQEYKQTPVAYRRCRRWLRIKKLLAETDMPFSQIATETGFSSRGHFYREVRALGGIAPSPYRNRAKFGMQKKK